MKKLKYILIPLAVIILCVGGYLVYELNFKSYDTADSEVDALIDERFNLELPDGTVIDLDKDGNVIKSEKNENTDTTENIIVTGPSSLEPNDPSSSESNDPSNSKSNGNEEEKTGTGNTGASNGNNEENSTSKNSNQVEKPNKTNVTTEKEKEKKKEKVTVSMIKSKYENTFKMLENQSRARLNSLVSRAANEYSTKKSNGESISYGYFYKKYMGAARGIESATDSTVNYVVGLVEKDLQANGYDKSYAQSFAEDYKATKEALRSEMMGKVMDFR